MAIRVLRLYPAAWRMRYEEEVRALLEDSPPGVGQLFELIRGAASECVHACADPVSHPGTAAVVRAGFGFVGVFWTIQLVGVSSGAVLRRVTGDSPDWTGPIANAAVLAVVIRGMVTALSWHRKAGPFRPVGGAELRSWWAVLVLAVVLGHWGRSPAMAVWHWWIVAEGLLLATSERAWMRSCARRLWTRVREEHRELVGRYSHASQLVKNGRLAPHELFVLGQAVARSAAALDRAAADRRAAGLSRLPPRHPIGLT
jgi:hypothetical protein